MDNKYFLKKVNKTAGRLQLSFNRCNPSTAFPVKIWAEKLQHKLGQWYLYKQKAPFSTVEVVFNSDALLPMQCRCNSFAFPPVQFTTSFKDRGYCQPYVYRADLCMFFFSSLTDSYIHFPYLSTTQRPNFSFTQEHLSLDLVPFLLITSFWA